MRGDALLLQCEFKKESEGGEAKYGWCGTTGGEDI